MKSFATLFIGSRTLWPMKRFIALLGLQVINPSRFPDGIRDHAVGRILMAVLWVVMALIIVAFLFVGLWGTIMPNNQRGPWEQMWRFPLVLFAAGIAWALREGARRTYALIEILVGLVIAYSLKDPTLDLRTRLATLASAVYVIIRGFDNLAIGIRMAREPKPPPEVLPTDPGA
jgi:uncharacterized membrane protein